MPQTLEAVFVHGNDQRRLDFTPSGAAVVNGQVVNMGSGLTGICTSPEGIADGVLGSLATANVFRLKKAAGAGVTFARGAQVGWDDTNNLAVAAGDWKTGVCVKAAANGDDGVWVDINRQQAVHAGSV